jgi:Protein of unknown function (DUF2961)
MRRLLVATLGMALSANPADAAGKVTLESLLRQMTDLSLLAEFPDPPYVARQFSSYDRASEAPGKESWFANDDHGFMLYDGVVKEKTLYFKSLTGLKAAEGAFAAGTKVGIAPNRRLQGDYVWAYATGPDGRAVDGQISQGWIPKSAIILDKQGHVLAEMDGPGCIVRIWSPNPQDAGNIRIYLDGAEKPVIEAPMEALLSGKWSTSKPGTPGGQWIPFPDPIACERSRGWNLYFPIPYAKHCKICTDKQDIYYHLDYRTYPKETEIETLDFFTLSKTPNLTKIQEALQVPAHQTRATNTSAGHDLPIGLLQDLVAKELTTRGDETNLKPGGKLQFSFDGPGLIRALSVNVRNSNEMDAMRGLVLIGTFDGAAAPQIRCPLGDFFASSPGVNVYQSLPFSVTRTGASQESHLQCKWPMPFQKSAKF